MRFVSFVVNLSTFRIAVTGLSIYRKCLRLLTVALLLVVQLACAVSVTAAQPSASSQTLSEPEPGAENGESQPPPAVEIAPISVPVSDAVKEAALLMRPSGATLDQVVAAMVLLNPAEFKHGDLQHVIFSRPLNVPSTQEILREDPDGLALLLLQLDIVSAASPLTGFNDRASLPQAVAIQQESVPAAESILQERTAEPETPAAEASLISDSAVWIWISAILLLISLLWLLFIFGRSRPRQPLSTSSSVLSSEESSNLQPMQDDQRISQLYGLPDEYLNYDDVEVLLTRLIGDSPDASRHVLQLMHFFRMKQNREGFQRQHQYLLESGFYQRHAEMWSVINQDAAELGLELNAAIAERESVASEEKIQRLQERVKKAEDATRAAEKRASKAELRLSKMQLQLDFGEN